MNTFRYFTIGFSILLLSVSVEGLQCLQGQRLLQNGFEVSNTLRNYECLNSNSICHRYDVTASANGETATIEQGDCLPSNSCDEANCAVFEKTLNQILPQAKLKYCCSYCCDSANCNNVKATSSNGECSGAVAVTFKLWLMIITTLMALASVYMFN